MSVFLIILLSAIPDFVNCQEDDSSALPQMLSGKQPVLPNILLKITYYLFFVLCGYFAIILFLGIFCCKPKNSAKPGCFQIIFHIFTAFIVLIASSFYLIAITRLKINGNSNSQQVGDGNPDLFVFSNFPDQIQHQKQKSAIDIYHNSLQLYESSNSLKDIAFNYNNTFSSLNGKYRTFFNSLYFDSSTNLQLKNALESMDKSRNIILNNIVSFSDQSIQLSTATKVFHPKSIKSDQIYNDVLKFPVYYIHIALTFFFSLFYVLLFFCRCLFTRMMFCFFPFFMAVILVVGFFSGFYIKVDKYDSFIDECQIQANLVNFKEIRNRLSIDSDTVSSLYRSINSNKIHKNFNSLSIQFKSIEKFNEMVQIIRNEEIKVKQMRNLTKTVTKSTFSVLSQIQEIMGNNDSIEFFNGHSNLNCDTIIEGFNYSVYASLVLFFGMILMSISVCVRRTSLKDTKIENSDDDTKETVTFKTYKYSSRDMYFMFYMADSKKPDISSFVRDGPYGPGFYFSASPGEAFIQWYLNTMDENHIVEDVYLRNIYAFRCYVHFGKSLDVPDDKVQFYSYPESVNQYECQSVIGHHSGSVPTEFVLFDSNRFDLKEFSLYTEPISINQINNLIRSLS